MYRLLQVYFRPQDILRRNLFSKLKNGVFLILFVAIVNIFWHFSEYVFYILEAAQKICLLLLIIDLFAECIVWHFNYYRNNEFEQAHFEHFTRVNLLQEEESRESLVQNISGHNFDNST